MSRNPLLDRLINSLEGNSLTFDRFAEKHNKFRDDARERGIPQDELFENLRDFTVDDSIGLAKAIRAQPDVYWFWEDLVKRRGEDGDADWDPNYSDMIGRFKALHWMKQGLPSQFPGAEYPSQNLLLAHAEGKITNLDGPEARDFLDKIGFAGCKLKIFKPQGAK